MRHYAPAICIGAMALLELQSTAAADPSTSTRGHSTNTSQWAERQMPAELISCRPGTEINTTVSRLLGMADTNSDGKVDKREATSLANFFVGGFFFRADANGDGVVTPAEGREARRDFINGHPAIATLLERTQQVSGKKPMATLADVVGIEYGKPLSLTEARRAARRSVDDLYTLVDADHNGFISADEARLAGGKGVESIQHALFDWSDSNDDGHVTLQEFDASIRVPANEAFRAADSDGNGQLTEAEAANAMAALAAHITMAPARSTHESR